MLSYIIRRLLLLIPTLIGMTIVVFAVMAAAPGNVGANLLSEEGAMRPDERQAMIDYLNRRYGLDKPVHIQYLRWLNQISPVGFKTNDDGSYGAFRFKTPDLGESRAKGRPVIDVVGEAIQITLLLNIVTIPIIYGIAITTGIYAARKRGGAFDVGSGVTFVGLWSLPVMWVGIMAIGFLASRDFLALFPTGGLHSVNAESMRFLPSIQNGSFARGWLLDLVWHLILPVACLTYGGFAFLSKLMRASVLENLSSDFVRTARAKGVSERGVLYVHVLRNSVLPLITVAASILPGLLGGSLIVEQIFSINGMGRLMIEAIRERDSELVLSMTCIVGFIGLLSLLLADLCYAIADPRVSYD